MVFKRVWPHGEGFKQKGAKATVWLEAFTDIRISRPEVGEQPEITMVYVGTERLL